MRNFAKGLIAILGIVGIVLFNQNHQDIEDSTITAQSLVKQGCNLWSSSIAAKEPGSSKSDLAITSEVVNIFNKAANLDANFTNLSESTSLLKGLNGIDIGSLPSDVKSRALLAILELKSKCTN